MSENKRKDKSEDDSRTVIEQKTGIAPKELLKAPAEPPKIKDKREPTDKQKSTFIMGVFIILAGLVAYSLLGLYISAFIVIVGLGVVVYSVIFRIEENKQ